MTATKTHKNSGHAKGHTLCGLSCFLWLNIFRSRSLKSNAYGLRSVARALLFELFSNHNSCPFVGGRFSSPKAYSPKPNLQGLCSIGLNDFNGFNEGRMPRFNVFNEVLRHRFTTLTRCDRTVSTSSTRCYGTVLTTLTRCDRTVSTYQRTQ
jgi:hypothetical protein